MLLIDEVDVFFSKDFIGDTYNPVELLQDDSITKLIEFVWENNLNKIIQIQQTPQYKEVKNKFPEFQFFWIQKYQK